MQDGSDADARPTNYARLGLRVLVIAVAVYLLHTLIGWVTAKTEATGNMPLMLGLMAALLLSYALLMAIPFAPGIEIGVSLLVLRGAEIAPFVYLATLLGLSIAFLAGRYVPYGWLHGVFSDLRLTSACRLLERIGPLKRTERLALLRQRLPSWIRPALGKGKYLMLAGLLNLPGNVIIGGGGGLAFFAGFSRLYHTTGTLMTMALAVLPVPLSVWLFGAGFLENGP